MFVDDTVIPSYSATRAACRIYQQSLELGLKAWESMVVFKNKRGQIRFISDTLVNALLRKAASAILKLSRATRSWQGHTGQ